MMELNCFIREIRQEEIKEALSLVWKVFQAYEAPDYTEEGVEEFDKSIHDEKYLSELCWYGAFFRERLIGVIATRNEGKHIALFFVDGKYQRQGIGKQLYQAVLSSNHSDVMTVNSSPYAVTVYHKLGFKDTGAEQVVNGLRFVPMKLEIRNANVEKAVRLLATAGVLMLIAGAIFGILKQWICTALILAGAFGCLVAALNFRNRRDK